MIYLSQLLKEIITEGGNVFGSTPSIKKEYISSTIFKFSKELNQLYPKVKFDFKLLGSAGKKEESGDIDLALNVDHFLTKEGKPLLNVWNINSDSYNKLYEAIRKRAKNAPETQSKIRAIIELISEDINRRSKSIQTNPKASIKGSLFCYFNQYNEKGENLNQKVQIDINIGNLDWLGFSYHSSSYKNNIKGLHRNQFISALFNGLGMLLDRSYGVKSKEGKILTTSPQGVIDLLNKGYNLKITRDILDDYHKLTEYVKNNVSEDRFKTILDTYLRYLDKAPPKADIPGEFQDYWIKNRGRLNLKGTYIPDNSNLAKYKH
jgi:hypothetical protein